MTDYEKVLVLQLISAVEDFKLPIRAKLGNIDNVDDIAFNEMDAERERRAEALAKALAAVKALI